MFKWECKLNERLRSRGVFGLRYRNEKTKK